MPSELKILILLAVGAVSLFVSGVVTRHRVHPRNFTERPYCEGGECFLCREEAEVFQ